VKGVRAWTAIIGARGPRGALWLGGCLPLIWACQRGELEAPVDILPQRYPNRLAETDSEVRAVVFNPGGGAAEPLAARAIARAAATADENAAGAEVVGGVVFGDVDGDGARDATATFSTQALLAAGLLSGERHTLEIRIEGSDYAWTGTDRLFEADAPLIRLPEPSGPFDVGTAALLVDGRSALAAPDDGAEAAAARTLLVRLWYPAATTERQPAPYFLDPRHAERNLRAAYLPFPADLFELTHGSARERVPAAVPEARPVLVLSTGWGVPVDLYGAIAEDFASNGYLVLGVNHPDGSGAVVYPDGSAPALAPELTVPDAATHRRWARDLERVARWIFEASADERGQASVDIEAAANVAAALGQADPARVVALGHSFGGSAAVRADADSDLIRAAADLDGAILGQAPALARRARALLLVSAEHSDQDPSLDGFLGAAGDASVAFEIDGASYANFGDTGWLFARLLELSPDLTREGYQLGPIAPDRAHAIVCASAQTFFAAALAAPAPRPPDLPGADFPELTPR
jgi:predicted dienelactone hydrolase